MNTDPVETVAGIIAHDVAAGVETDVLGIGRGDLSPEPLPAVTAAHPRPDFKHRIRMTKARHLS
jgi:hypothetical protein